MQDFPQRAAKVLKQVPDGFKSSNSGVVDLVSALVASEQGGRSTQMQELKELGMKLSDLQQDFIEAHNESCNRSMGQFMQLMGDMDHAKTAIGGLKTKVLGLRRAIGSYSEDLVSLYKRRQRNFYLLQILHAIREVQSMEAKKAALMSQRQYLACGNLMRSFQTMLEQWPVIRDSTSHRPDLPAVHDHLQMLLSSRKISEFLTSIEAILINSTLRKDVVRDPKRFATIMEGTDSRGTQRHPEPVGRRPHRSFIVRTTAADGLDEALLFEGTRLWDDDTPVATSLSAPLLGASVLRTPVVLPPQMQVSVTCGPHAKCTLLIGYLPGREGGIQIASNAAWSLSNATLGIVGDFEYAFASHPSSQGGNSPSGFNPGGGSAALSDVPGVREPSNWVFYQRVLSEGSSGSFPLPVVMEATYVILAVVPHRQSRDESLRSECLGALHAVGGVGTTRCSQNQRLLDTVGALLQTQRLSDLFATHIDEFCTAFDGWRTSQRRLPVGDRGGVDPYHTTQLLSHNRDLAVADAAQPRGGGAASGGGTRGGNVMGGSMAASGDLGSVGELTSHRRLVALQQPLLQRFVSALYGEMLDSLRGFASIGRETFSRCFPSLCDDGYRESCLGLVDEDLALLSKELVHAIATAPKQDSECDAALQVARKAADLLDAPLSTPRHQSPFALRHLVGSRRLGWLGLPPRKILTLHLRRQGQDPFHLKLSEDMKVMGCPEGGSAHAAGMSQHIGCVVTSVSYGERHIPVATPADFEDAVSGVASLDVHLYRKVSAPLAGVSDVYHRISDACQEAGDALQADPQQILEADQSLQNCASAAMKTLAVKRSEKVPLNLKEAWKAIQTQLVSLLRTLCASAESSSSGGGGGGSAKGDQTPGARGSSPGPGGVGGDPTSPCSPVVSPTSLSLEKLLFVKSSADRMPKILDGVLKVKFSLSGDLSEDEASQHSGSVTRHIVPSVFNAVSLYRATVHFQADAKGIAPNAVFSLERTLEGIALQETLPRLRDHYIESVTEAFANLNPSRITSDAAGASLGSEGGRSPPVLDAVVKAAEGIVAFVDMQKDLPFAVGTLREYAWGLADHVADLCLAQLKVRLASTFAGQVVIPMIKDLYHSIATSECLSDDTLALWRAGILPGESDATLALATALISKQCKVRSLSHVVSSQDLSFLATIVHSLEWFADQVELHGDHNHDTTGPAAGDESFSSRTACFSTVFPGLDEATASGEDLSPILLPKHPLSTAELEHVYSKLQALAGCALISLQVDVATRCFTSLDIRDLSFDTQHETVEPDAFVGIFNRDMRRLHALYTEYLPEPKHCGMLQAIPIYVCFYLIRGLSALKNRVVTEPGVARLQRNMFQLQQNLNLLVPDVGHSDDHFFRVRRYYEMLQCSPMDLRPRLEELEAAGISYTDAEFRTIEAIVLAAYAKLQTAQSALSLDV